MKKEIDGLKEEVDRLEGFSRRDNLRMFGVPAADGKEDYDSCARTVTDILNSVQGTKEWSADDISRAHRVGQSRNRGPRPTIVKFNRWRDKMAIITDKAFRQLLKDKGVTVANDLTRRQASMVADAKRDGKVAFFKKGQLILQPRQPDHRTYAEVADPDARHIAGTKPPLRDRQVRGDSGAKERNDGDSPPRHMSSQLPSRSRSPRANRARSGSSQSAGDEAANQHSSPRGDQQTPCAEGGDGVGTTDRDATPVHQRPKQDQRQHEVTRDQQDRTQETLNHYELSREPQEGTREQQTREHQELTREQQAREQQTRELRELTHEQQAREQQPREQQAREDQERTREQQQQAREQQERTREEQPREQQAREDQERTREQQQEQPEQTREHPRVRTGKQLPVYSAGSPSLHDKQPDSYADAVRSPPADDTPDTLDSRARVKSLRLSQPSSHVARKPSTQQRAARSKPAARKSSIGSTSSSRAGLSKSKTASIGSGCRQTTIDSVWESPKEPKESSTSLGDTPTTRTTDWNHRSVTRRTSTTTTVMDKSIDTVSSPTNAASQSLLQQMTDNADVGSHCLSQPLCQTQQDPASSGKSPVHLPIPSHVAYEEKRPTKSPPHAPHTRSKTKCHQTQVTDNFSSVGTRRTPLPASTPSSS